MSSPKNISVTARINPPVAPVAEDYVEVSVALTIRAADLGRHEASPAHVIGIMVGDPPDGVVDILSSEITTVFLDGDGQLKPAAEVARPAESLSAGLDRFNEWVKESGSQDSHLFLFASKSTIENIDRLGDRVEELRDLGGRADIFGTVPTLDFRLLGQLALTCGGRFYVGQDRWNVDAVSCLERQRARRFFDGRLGINLTPNLIPVSAFRLDPEPVHVRDFQVQPASEMCWFDLPIMSSADDVTTWLLRCLAPRKKAGEYRLLDYQVMGETVGGSVMANGMVIQAASVSPAEFGQVDARVEVQIDQTRASQWVEAVGQAYNQQNGSKIVSTFAPFMQHESLHGRPENVARLWALKGELMRWGYFGLKELNAMWCLAQGIELGASDDD